MKINESDLPNCALATRPNKQKNNHDDMINLKTIKINKNF